MTSQGRGRADPSVDIQAVIAQPGEIKPQAVIKHIHDAAKASIESAAFQQFARARALEVDYRAGEKLRKDLWDEYRAHTEILGRLGMLKK